MSYRLQRITDWPVRACAAKYRVSILAEQCDVSVRTLERYVKREFGLCPHAWITRLKMQRAVELLPETSSIKEAANALGYSNQNNFSREFKKHYGHAPTHRQGSLIRANP